MTRVLIYSDEAVEGLAQIAAGISKLSQRRAIQYLDEVSMVVESLLLLPASYPVADPAKNPDLRKMTFQKLTIVLYWFDDTQVYVENIRDARSNWAAPL